jgi:choline dehydrogenase-like flavoprotein
LTRLDRTSPTPLTPAQRATLAAVCDAFLPSLARAEDPGGLFLTGAAAAGTAERVERLFEQLPDPRDQARLRLLLSVLASPIGGLLGGGRLVGFARLDRRAREAALRAWACSALPVRRAGFQALKRLCQVAHFCWPLADGGHPAWRAVGYPGPLPQPPNGVQPLTALAVERDTVLECDIVVVGSGAGGGVVAGVLARAGRSVVVLEKGPNPGARDFTQVEGDMLNALYLDGGLLMTQTGSIPILAGSCVGGGTTVNWTTAFPLPDEVRREWDERAGLSLFSGSRFASALERVSARLGLSTRWNTPGARDAILERGCRAMGWHVDRQPRNVIDCREGLECGYCGYGCRHGAKQSTAVTYLRDAVQAGAALVACCEAVRVLRAGGRAAGVLARVRRADGTAGTLTVRASTVVAACGSIATPALLRRSGLANANIGRGLRLHPATAVLGVLPERVEPWGGALQTRYSDQFADQGGGYGARFETGPVHFALPASGFGWEGAEQMREDVARLAHTTLVGVLLRDRDAGRVRVGRDGIARVHYELTRYDVGHLRRALFGAAQVLAAAGAEEIVSLHTPPVRVRPGTPGWLGRFMADADRRGYTRCRLSYISFHQMGTAAMGKDPARSVVDETGETHELPGLYVADASTFPASSGVNPMLTIMAIADHVARGLEEAR